MSVQPALRPDTPLRRIVDLAVAGVGLVVMSPVLLILAVAVRASGPGPVIFRQCRIGRDGQPFQILKFRTMTVGTETSGPLVSDEEDPRITRCGRWMRRRRLDELPQLVNLLRGEVTLIGPRPEVPRYVEHYTDAERLLLRARPGIIGPGAMYFADAQRERVSTADDVEEHYLTTQLHPKLELDLEYLRDRGVLRDAKLLVRGLGYLIS